MADFDEDLAIQDVTRLRRDFSRFSGANLEKQKYYDGKQKLKDLGISLPPQMRLIDTVLGWPGTVVDALEERLILKVGIRRILTRFSSRTILTFLRLQHTWTR